jgi:GNAT superfamily N-acetyltransferase
MTRVVGMSATTDEEIRVEHVPVKELYEYACAAYDRSGPDDVIPIPKQVALAQTHNPYAEPGDVGLIVVSVDDRVAGFIGVLPGELKHGDHTSKLTYLSSFFVDSRHRGKGLGKLLVRSVMSLPTDLSGCSMSDDARYVYNSVGILGGIGPRTDVLLDLRRLRLKVDRTLSAVARDDTPARPVRRVAARLRSANERFLYPTLRRLFYLTLRASSRGTPADVVLEETDHIPEDALDGIPASPRAVFHRGVEWINWRLRHPWIANRADTDDNYDNYFFRAVQPHFGMYGLLLRGKQRSDLRGFVVLSISETETETTLKILDHHFKNEADAACVTDIIATYGRRYGVDRVHLAEHLARPLQRNAVARRFLVPSVHEYVTRTLTPDSPLALAMADIELDACDGDFPFT